MSNLIITIISIGLVAIAAIMAIYYGGNAFSQGQINGYATAMVSESQQLLSAGRLWAINNNQPDVSGMPCASATSGVWFVTSNACGFTGIGLLISDHELTNWPSLIGGVGNTDGYTVTSPNDNSCYSFSGYSGQIYRALAAYNGGNYVMIWFRKGGCSGGTWYSSTTDATNANHPMVLIAKAVNNTLKQIPTDADTSQMNYIGLPAPPTGSTNANQIYISPAGVIQTNYCYLAGSARIACVFGPS